MPLVPGIPAEIQLGYGPEPEPPEPESIESNFSTAEVDKLSRESLDFLAALCLPTVFKYFFPTVFKAIWSWLLSYVHRTRDFSQLAIGLPRGFGKTMLMKIFIIYVILFTKKQFILIICGTQSKANNIISDIASMLNEQNVKRAFGDWNLGIINERQDLKRFGFRGRNIILMGAGAESDIRGITLENVRPDIMLFDDIQTREDADSDVVSEKIETWMYGTAMKAKSPEGCLFIFIANMYPTKFSLLRKIKTNSNWVKFIAGGILADGTSLWEDLQPIAQLLREYENDLSAGKPEIFFAEVLNDENASVNRFIDISKIPENPYEDDSLHQGSYVIIDPATDKINADMVSIGYFELFDSKPVGTEIIEDRLSPGDICEQTIRLCLRRNCRLIVIESNAFQYVLGWIMTQTLERYGISGIEVVDIYSGQASKNSRILTMFKQLLAGELYVARECKSHLTSQIVSFNPLKTNNTDGVLDLFTYATRVPEMYGEFLTAGLVVEMQEFSGLPVHTEQYNSPF
jgi:hypothetical protein